jgi:hypothetical protein
METRVERGRRLGRRYVTAAFGTLAGVFILSTTKQLSFGVFGVDAAPVAQGLASATVAEGSCVGHLRAMAAAVDRAISASARAPDEANAAVEYRAALSPEWNDAPTVEAGCSAEGHGADALATIVRLRVAGEQLARRHASELAPLRRDVAAYLPP